MTNLNKLCQRKIQGDIRIMSVSPPEYIYAYPDEDNLLTWYFMIDGPEWSKYKGGHYIGQILHDKDYPLKPPDYVMLTPSGRFMINQKICMSNTKFHTDEWSAAWNISTILAGFLSIMLDDAAHGIAHLKHHTDAEIAEFADQSIAFNEKNYPKIYKEFQRLIENRKMAKEKQNSYKDSVVNKQVTDDTKPKDKKAEDNTKNKDEDHKKNKDEDHKKNKDEDHKKTKDEDHKKTKDEDHKKTKHESKKTQTETDSDSESNSESDSKDDDIKSILKSDTDSVHTQNADNNSVHIVDDNDSTSNESEGTPVRLIRVKLEPPSKNEHNHGDDSDVDVDTNTAQLVRAIMEKVGSLNNINGGQHLILAEIDDSAIRSKHTKKSRRRKLIPLDMSEIDEIFEKFDKEYTSIKGGIDKAIWL